LKQPLVSEFGLFLPRRAEMRAIRSKSPELRADSVPKIHRLPHSDRNAIFSRMKAKRSAAILTAVLAVSLIGSFGQVSAQAPRMNAGLTYMLGLFRLRVVAGRITVAGAMSFQTHKGEFKTNDRHERLELTQAGPSTTFHYELSTPDAQLTWDLLAGNEIRIRRLPRRLDGQQTGAASQETGGAKAKLVVFGQPTEGPLMLSVGEGDERKECRGATVWHLLLTDPELCRSELLPLLQVMKPGWDLLQRAQTIESLLFHSADIEGQLSRETWLRHVAELGHGKFARRQAADRRLRLGGPEALPFLLSLDLDRLDSEQRFRVLAIIRSSTVKEDDLGKDDVETLDQIVRTLRADPILWLELLERDEEQRRRIAARQLTLLLNETIEFDPAAESAQRKMQIDRLRHRFQP